MERAEGRGAHALCKWMSILLSAMIWARSIARPKWSIALFSTLLSLFYLGSPGESS